MTTSVIASGFHGQYGPGTTQGVLVFDGDHGFLASQQFPQGLASRFLFVTVATTGTRGVDEGGLHGETIIGGKLLVGV